MLKSFLFILVLIGFISCKKVNPVVNPPFEAHFTNVEGGTYFVTAPGKTYKVPVGLTGISAEDVVVSFTVSSPTGAVAGTHYTIVGGNSITIPVGKALDSITVLADFTKYVAGRKDTLIFAITTGTGAKVSSYNSVYKLFVRGACLEDDIIFTDLLGTYTKTFENGSYGPYVSTLINFASVNATSGKATLTNIYDSGISAQVTFDWSTLGSFTATVPNQPTGFTSGGNPLFIRSAAPGSFKYCAQTFTLPLELYTSAGSVDSWVTTLAR